MFRRVNGRSTAEMANGDETLPPIENACESNGCRTGMCVYLWTGISGGNLLLLSDHDALTEEVLH